MNQRAIAHVIALYLWEYGHESETDLELPSRLKNQVHRALTGRRLTGQLLEHIINAFDMDDQDRESLWSTYSGHSSVSHTVRQPRPMGKRQWHRTIALFEHWYFGDRGELRKRRTVQCIEALEDGVDSYLYNHEREATQINVIHGGFVGRHYEYGHGLISDDINLHLPLAQDKRTSIEYETLYSVDYSPTEVRRPARGRTENVTLAVHFTPSRLPRQLWFSAWEDHYLGVSTHDEPLQLNANGSSIHCLRYIEQTVVGFRWTW